MGEILSQSFQGLDLERLGDETVEYWSYELKRYEDQRRRLEDRVRIVETPYRRCVDKAPVAMCGKGKVATPPTRANLSLNSLAFIWAQEVPA